MKKNLKSFSFIFCLISLVFTQEGSFKSGNIKYEVNNLEFSFSDKIADVSFKLGKFSTSNSNQSVFISNNGYADLSLGPSKIQIQNIITRIIDHPILGKVFLIFILNNNLLIKKKEEVRK